MPNNAYAVSASQLGIAIETVRGTPVAPVFWIPVKAPKYKPNVTELTDTTLQGSMVEVYDLVPGLRYDSHGWDGQPYLDSFPVFLRALLGSTDTVTAKPTNTTLAASAVAGASTVSCTATIASGSWITIGSGATIETHLTTAVSGAGPYTVTLATPLKYAQASAAAVSGLTKHQFSLLNSASGSGDQPPSVTITDFDGGDQWRQLAASQLDKLTIKGTATGLAEYNCSWFANASITPSTPSPSFTGVQAPPGWTVQVAVGGTVLNYLVDWEFDFSRQVKPIPALTGTQAYYAYFAAALQASAKITVVEQSGAPELSAYLAGTQESLDLTLSDTRTGYALNLHSTKAQFKTGELDRSKDWAQAVLDVQLLPSSTDALAGGVSPVIASVGNGQTTSY